MQRCPKCNSLFPDTDHFCELDGVTLEPVPVTVASPTTRQGLLPIVAVAGVVLGALLFLVYFASTRKKAIEQPEPVTSSHTAQAQLPVRPVKPVAAPSPSPTVEPSPSPSVEPSPSPQSTPKRVQLSTNPISTAVASKEKSGPVVIKLDSGVAIEADEAWQTAEGIWYRKSGVVSLLNPKNVKAIEKPVVANAQPVASPKPSP